MTEPTDSGGPPPSRGPSPSSGLGWQARVFSKENLLALAICLILIAVIILNADSAPRWIYQGF